MIAIAGKEVGAGNMQPLSGATHPHAGFIDMENMSVLQEFSDIVFGPAQVLRALVHD
jgi:hypothetical protein